MSITYVERVATGLTGSNTISIPFPYLRKEDVRVYVDGVERDFSTLTWSGDYVVRLPDADSSLTGKTILAKRVTPIDNASATFAPGLLDQDDLNLVTLQGLYHDQEKQDDDALYRAGIDGLVAGLGVDVAALDDRVTAVELDVANNVLPAVEAARDAAQAAAANAEASELGAAYYAGILGLALYDFNLTGTTGDEDWNNA